MFLTVHHVVNTDEDSPVSKARIIIYNCIKKNIIIGDIILINLDNCFLSIKKAEWLHFNF